MPNRLTLNRRGVLRLGIAVLPAFQCIDDLRAQRDSLASFLRVRSGLQIDADLLDRLETMEARCQSGAAGRILPATRSNA